MFLTALLPSRTADPRLRRAKRSRLPVSRWPCVELLETRTLLSGYTNFTPIWDSAAHGAHAPALNGSGAVAFAWHPSVRDSV
jgi:hypothetical protein